jgi:sensor histidine kinase YesM
MQESIGFNKRRILIHVGTWMLLFLFPYLLSQGENIVFARLAKTNWVPLSFYIILFYSNYNWLLENYLFQKKNAHYFIINTILIAIVVVVYYQLREFFDSITPISVTNPYKPPASLFIYKDIISMTLPVFAAYTLSTSERWKKKEAETLRREKEILNSELQHLRYQLQPHFFFNSLNTVYALIDKSPVMAQETVHHLAGLMRYLLNEGNTGKVNLNKEIDFMKRYIGLMKLRINEQTKIQVNFQDMSESYQVAPLLFISLIENAFKHGVSSKNESELFFSLSVENKIIRFFAQNTSYYRTSSESNSSGIGLINLQKRLELYYPQKHTFEITKEAHRFTALLEINLN